MLRLLGFGGSVAPFSVEPDNVTVHPNGEITATGTDKFSDFVFDLDAIAASPLYGIGAPTLGANVNLQDLGIPLDLVLGYDIFDADAHVDFTASQTLTFTPSISIKFSFDPPPADITGPYESKALDNSWVIFAPGEQVSIEFPAGRVDPIDVTPQVLLSSTLHNLSSLGTNSFIQLKAGRFDYQIPGFEIFPKFGPFDTELDYPHPHGDVKWDEIHVTTHFHDVVVEGVVVCPGCNVETHTTTHHHDSFSFGRIFHLHNVFIDLHDINIGPWGPWGFPGLDVSQEPVWGPEDYAESAGPPSGLADETFSLPFAPFSLSSFQLDPEVPPIADAGGPYDVDESLSITLDGSASYDVDLPAQTLTHAWDLDDDGSFETPGVTAIFNGIDGPSDHTVTLQVCDHLNCTEDAVNVHVNNVAPTANAGPDPDILEWVPGLKVTLDGSLSSDPADPLTYSWADSNGNVVGTSTVVTVDISGLGAHVFTLTVDDGDGGSHSDTVTVTVVDTTAPVIDGLIASPDGPWPPNHKMRSVTVAVDVSDTCDANPTCSIVGVTSNEPVNGKGDGNTSPDWEITGDLTVDLRAERSGNGDGRVYTITVRCTDASGNFTTSLVTVTVSHDQGNGKNK